MVWHHDEFIQHYLWMVFRDVLPRDVDYPAVSVRQHPIADDLAENASPLEGTNRYEIGTFLGVVVTGKPR